MSIPPRLEIVAEQENSDRFPSYTGNQFAFDGFFRHQAHGPTCAAFRRIAAYHCNQTLFLALIKHFSRARPRSFVQRPLQSALPVATADVAFGFGSEKDYFGDLRRWRPLPTAIEPRRAEQPEPVGRRRLTAWQALFDASA